MRELRQGTAFTFVAGFVDAAGDPATGLDIDHGAVLLSKNGGTLTAKSDTTDNAAADGANGDYLITCNATDADTLGHLRVRITKTGALPYVEDFLVLSTYEWDRKYTDLGRALGGVIAYGLADSATATGIVLDGVDPFEDGSLVGSTVFAYGSDQGYWQQREVAGNTGPSLVVDLWTETPSGDITVIVFGNSPVSTVNPPIVSLTTSALTALVAGVFARAFGSDYGNRTFDELIKIMASESAGKNSGMGGTTNTFRSLGDTKNVIVATTDGSGNRTAVTLTP